VALTERAIATFFESVGAARAPALNL